MVESEFPDTGSIASDLMPILQTKDTVENNSHDVMQLMEDHPMEVDDEPIASSSAIQLENLHTASSTGYASANYALGLLRPQENKKKLVKKQLLSATGHGDTFSDIIMGSSTRAKRKCKVCTTAGRDGSNCPGSGGRSKCLFM